MQPQPPCHARSLVPVSKKGRATENKQEKALILPDLPLQNRRGPDTFFEHTLRHPWKNRFSRKTEKNENGKNFSFFLFSGYITSSLNPHYLLIFPKLKRNGCGWCPLPMLSFQILKRNPHFFTTLLLFHFIFTSFQSVSTHSHDRWLLVLWLVYTLTMHQTSST